MSNRENLLTPVGRLVQGSLYDGKTTDAENRPLEYKTGPNAGQQRLDFFFSIAIAKGVEQHWSQTTWGALIYQVGKQSFPQGQHASPAFAWKIIDGDSAVPNKNGKKPCDREGFKGHWILNFSSGFAPGIYNADGTQQMLQPNAVNLGDYIQVYGNVSGNESQQQPGIYLNHSMVAFAGYGDRIVVGADPKSVGFGNSPLPAGVSATPKSQGFNPVPPVETTPAPQAPAAAPAAYVPPVTQIPVTPHTAILTPPVTPAAPPPVPVRVMTEKCQGATYEQLIGAGWTDALLVQHGMMVA